MISMRQTAWLSALSVAIVALWLWAVGQPWICTCGTIKLWDGNIFSSGNSQHIADWYTLSHVLHGVLIVLVGRIVAPRVRMTTLLYVAVITGVAWEVIEHTPWVLDRFRAATINQGYVGDSILNACCDFLWMMLGFLLASRMSQWGAVALIIVFEITSTLAARDSLALTTLMVIWPIDAVAEWQKAQ